MKYLTQTIIAISALFISINSYANTATHKAQLKYEVEIQNTSGSKQTNIPVTFGQVFLEGDIPAGYSFKGYLHSTQTVIPLQTNKKATHPDGSLRHAIFSAVIPSIAGGRSVKLETIPYPAGADDNTAAPLSSLLSTNFNADVTLTLQNDSGGGAYKISVRELLEKQSAKTWLSGPVMTEWMVSAPLKSITNNQEHAHLAARFHIRKYSNSENIRLDTAIENNWTFAQGPRNLFYDAAITIDGKQAYAINSLPHFKHSRWRKVLWSQGEPQIHIKHDPVTLIGSKAVPHYDPKLVNNISSSILDHHRKIWTDNVDPYCAWYGGSSKKCPDVIPENMYKYSLSRIQPMGKGLVYYTAMASPGDTEMLGPLPRWTAAYILGQEALTKKAMLGTGDLGGSWGIHYRDKETDLPVSMLKHPKLTIDKRFEKNNTLAPRCEDTYDIKSKHCALAYKPDNAHQPSFAYVPYLVTGDYYYLEEMQFWATYNAAMNRPEYREFDKGLFLNFEDRGQAWTLRKLARVTAFTPDGHPLKADFKHMLDSNLDRYAEVYLNTEPNGYGSLISRIYPRSSPWMDDFFTWAVTMASDLGFEKATNLAKWKGKFAVMRMGEGTANKNDYCYIFAAAYHMSIGPGTSLTSYETEGMYKTIKEVYDATNQKDIDPGSSVEIRVNDGNTECGSQAQADFLSEYRKKTIVKGQLDANSTASGGFVAILQMALASAVDAGTVGSDAAWRKFASLPVRPDGSKNPKYTLTPREEFTRIKQLKPPVISGP